MRLRRQVHQHAAAGLVDGGFDDVVQRLVAVHQHRAGVAVVEAQQAAVRAVGVEADEGHLLVDEVLRQQPRHHRLADAALFATDEVDLRGRLHFQGGDFHLGFLDRFHGRRAPLRAAVGATGGDSAWPGCQRARQGRQAPTGSGQVQQTGLTIHRSVNGILHRSVNSMGVLPKPFLTLQSPREPTMRKASSATVNATTPAKPSVPRLPRQPRTHDSAATMARITEATMQLLADRGFPALGVNAVAAAAARVPRRPAPQHAGAAPSGLGTGGALRSVAPAGGHPLGRHGGLGGCPARVCPARAIPPGSRCSRGGLRLAPVLVPGPQRWPDRARRTRSIDGSFNCSFSSATTLSPTSTLELP